jgi:hypothetical protein
VQIWHLPQGRKGLTLNVPDAVEVPLAAFSVDAQQLLTLDWNKARKDPFLLRDWDLATGRQQGSWTVPSDVYPLAVLGGRAFLATFADYGVGVYDLDAERLRLRRHLDDGRLAGLDRQWGHVRLRRRQGVSLAMFPTPSPDGKMVASGLGSTTGIWLWELMSGQEVLFLNGQPLPATCIAWSPDGCLLASGNQRGKLRDPFGSQTVCLWNAATGTELARFALRVDVTALAFSPDGAWLAVGLRDGSIALLPIVTERRAAELPGKLGPEDLTDCWARLADSDAGAAYRALALLVAAPAESVPYLQRNLKPVAALPPATLRRWIVDLDSPKFAVRQAAVKALEKAGAQAQVPVQKALAGSLSLEARLRLEKVLSTLADAPVPESLRNLRAIVALERIGSLQARAALEILAQGAPGARETEEAKAALARRTQIGDLR